MRKWTDRWMQLVDTVASFSGDTSTKCGAVIVDERNVLLSVGWNDLPRGVIEQKNRRERPAKYKWTEHAERNAIFNAAAKGIECQGATMYLNWYPCADCARAIIQAGISKIVCVEPDWYDERWGDDFDMVREMFIEVGMTTAFI